MAEVIKSRSLRPRQAVDYTKEGTCKTPAWLGGGGGGEVEEVAKKTKPRSKARAVLGAVTNKKAEVARTNNKKGAVAVKPPSVPKTKEAAAPAKKASVVAPAKRASEVQVERPAEKKKRPKVVAPEVVEDDIEDDIHNLIEIDDVPEAVVQRPVKQRNPVAAAVKSSSRPRAEERTTRAPTRATTTTTTTDTAAFLELQENHNKLLAKYNEMKMKNFRDVELSLGGKILKEHTEASDKLAKTWRDEAMRLEALNTKACSEETLQKIRDLSFENAELKQRVAEAELRELALAREEERVQRTVEEAKVRVTKAEERAATAEAQSRDVLSSADHRISAANLRMGEMQIKLQEASEQARNYDSELQKEVATANSKLAAAEMSNRRDAKLFEVLTGMAKKYMPSGSTCTYNFVHKRSGFSFHLRMPNTNEDFDSANAEILYEASELGTAAGELPEYFCGDGIEFSGTQLPKFFSKMLPTLQKCRPAKTNK